jgi:hypothetical protein
MDPKKKQNARFSASKREFLKRLALLTVYVGPLMKTFQMTEMAGKPTGPVKKKRAPGDEDDEEKSGEVFHIDRGRKSKLA